MITSTIRFLTAAYMVATSKSQSTLESSTPTTSLPSKPDSVPILSTPISPVVVESISTSSLDRESALNAIKHNQNAINDISDELKNDNEFIRRLLTETPIELINFPIKILSKPEMAQLINTSPDLLLKSHVLPKPLLLSLMKHISRHDLSPVLLNYVLRQSPVIYRDEILSKPTMTLPDLFPFDLTFIETNPTTFLPRYKSDLTTKHIQIITHKSLYTIQTQDRNSPLDIQTTLYHTQMPTVLFIETDHIHSGHNELLQDRRWLGTKISDQVKVVIVGAYDDLTNDIQTRIEAEYIDEYSVRYTKHPSEKQHKVELYPFKQLPALTTQQLLEIEVITLEQMSRYGNPTHRQLVLQNSDELAALSSLNKKPAIVYRYLSHRILDKDKTPDAYNSSDIVVYQYLSSVEKQLNYHLTQHNVDADNPTEIQEFLRTKTIHIPEKPRLGIISEIRKQKEQWQLNYNGMWYTIHDIATHSLTTHPIEVATPAYHVNKEHLYTAYIENNDIYMGGSIAQDIFNALYKFAVSDNQWIILEGIPALGKDAYTKQFLHQLRQQVPNLHIQEISSSQDQSLLENIVDISQQHPHTYIIFHVSEINLMSHAQLMEIRHFCQNKSIKLIGTQNSQSQIQTRFKLDDTEFPIVKLTLQTPETHIKQLIDWVSKKYKIPMQELNTQLSWIYRSSNSNPPTPRQLIYLAKQLQKELKHSGLNAMYNKATPLLNTIFFRYTHCLWIMKPQTISEPLASPDANTHTVNEVEHHDDSTIPVLNDMKENVAEVTHYPHPSAITSLHDMMHKKTDMYHTSYELIPGQLSPATLWAGDKYAFIEYTPDTSFYIAQHDLLTITPNTLSTTIHPSDTILIPEIIGSRQGTLYLERSTVIHDINSLVDLPNRIIRNTTPHPITVHIVYDNPLPLFSEIRSTAFEHNPLHLHEAIDTSLLLKEEASILTRFIFEKRNTHHYTKYNLLLSLDLPLPSEPTTSTSIEMIYDYFSQFREERVPVETSSNTLLYDALYFKKGVCRHQSALGRLFFLALGIPVEKKHTLNYEGEPFHEYLIVTINKARIVMDFYYTPNHMIQMESVSSSDDLTSSHTPSLTPKPTSNSYALIDANYTSYMHEWGTELSSKGQKLIDPLWSSLYSYMYPDVEPTAIPYSTNTSTLNDLLTGSRSQWNTHKETIKWSLFDTIPSAGATLETQFVPLTESLNVFGLPVYEGNKLIGYRIQREVPSNDYYTGIFLDPKDSIDHNYSLLLTRQGIITSNDKPNNNDLIPVSTDAYLRALELVQDLSMLLNIPFIYENQFALLKTEDINNQYCAWRQTTGIFLRGTYEHLVRHG